MAEEGVTFLYEIGAGKVLSGMARRIDERLTGKALGTRDDIEAAGDNPASTPAL
jgi:[acyl-carrier-protein] S-malonyltransferase